MASTPLSTRITLAWKALRGARLTERDGRPIQTKRNPLAWPAMREGKPEWRLIDLETYVREGYNLNSLIYSAIMFKARAVTSAPLRAYVGDIDHPKAAPPDHWLTRLLDRPNPYQSGAELQSLCQVYWNLAGNCFVHLDRERTGLPPRAMRALRPDRVTIIPAAGGIKGYYYIPEGRTWQDGFPILPMDMIHHKLPNPGDPLEGLGYGLSPIAPLAQSADTDNQVTAFLKTFFERGTMVSSLIVTKDPITEPEIARIRERWREYYGGSENWGEIGVLDGTAAEFQRLSLSFEEMGFETIDERNESRILGPFGVPPILLGTRVGLERSTDTNYQNARRSFWEDTFVPELNLQEQEYRFYLTSDDGAFCAYDYAEVPALQENIGEQTEAAHRLWTMGVPVNQALKAVGLAIGDVPGGEIGYVPKSVVPLIGGKPPAILTERPALRPPGSGQNGDSGQQADGARADNEVRKAALAGMAVVPRGHTVAEGATNGRA